MATFRFRRVCTGALVLAAIAPACGGAAPEAAAGAAETESPAVNSDLVNIAIRLGELERRVEALEGGGPADGETGTDEESGAPEGTEPPGTDEHGAEPADDADHAATPHWGYADAEHWGEMAAEFATCSIGSEQSPIDLTKATPASIEDADLSYVPAAASVTDNGHTVQVDLTDAGTAVVDGHEYALEQFHFHAPSEHTVDGVHSPVEAHFVHADADGNLAVIGALIVEGEADPVFDAIIAAIPAVGEHAELPTMIDARALLPDALMAYRYHGSLTTPPCSEGVTWSVLQQPITWSAEQVTALTAHLAEANNRPIQALNDRELQVDLVPG